MQAVANGDVIHEGDERGKVRVGLLTVDPVLDSLRHRILEYFLYGDGGGPGDRDGSDEVESEDLHNVEVTHIAGDPGHLGSKDGDLSSGIEEGP